MCFAKAGQGVKTLDSLNTKTDAHHESWECYTMTMAKHKCLEKMEHLNSEEADSLSHEDMEDYKNCAKTLYYLSHIEK